MHAFLDQELVVTRTPTLPTHDKSMWRKVKARAHPDAGGDHELFVWLSSVEKLVCSDGGDAAQRPEPRPSYQPPSEEPARVPWEEDDDFEECTGIALKMGAVGDPYGLVLSLLADCYPLGHLAHEQERGATYKRLAAIAHLWGMTKPERIGWYRVAENIPLSDRHAGHILGRLKRRAA
jgi:hypothetical protein